MDNVDLKDKVKNILARVDAFKNHDERTINKSIIRLFKSIAIYSDEKRNISPHIIVNSINRGFVFEPIIAGNYSDNELEAYIKIIEQEIGLTPEKMNSSFHKSWDKVKNASMLQLVVEQLTHYITTYGFEWLGIYDENTVYIPHEKLNIPEIDSDIKVVIIKGYTKDEIKKKVTDLLSSGIALSDESICDIINILGFIGVDNKYISVIKNKEVRTKLYDELDIIPEKPEEFLRLLVFKASGNTLLIKNEETISAISAGVTDGLPDVKPDIFERYDLSVLSQIFYRYKPLFLAFRKNDELKPYINKIRRLARQNHRPMKEDFLNSVTAMLKKGTLDLDRLEEELKKVNTFRKIRLAYSLKYRMSRPSSILYRVRNGKGYATSFASDKVFNDSSLWVAGNIMPAGKSAMVSVVASIVNDISKKVKGKKIYIPDYINYALPSSEKMFTGNFPSGTSVFVPDNMIAGIHWEDVDNHRIDLDLSIVSLNVGKIGWDGRWRNDEVLFSGDITAAPKPNGASELFHFNNERLTENCTYLMYVNYYNFDDEELSVPYKILVAKEILKSSAEFRHYMVNPNAVVSIVKSKIDKKQKVIGFIDKNEDGYRFYYAESYVGNSITSSANESAQHTRDYMVSFYRNSISLNDLIKLAGGIIVNTKDNVDIDLSPENLEKDSIISLFG